MYSKKFCEISLISHIQKSNCNLTNSPFAKIDFTENLNARKKCKFSHCKTEYETEHFLPGIINQHIFQMINLLINFLFAWCNSDPQKIVILTMQCRNYGIFRETIFPSITPKFMSIFTQSHLKFCLWQIEKAIAAAAKLNFQNYKKVCFKSWCS